MGDYSSGDVAALPGTSANLDHVYDATDLSNVGTNDTNYVNQTGSSGYELHQYKDSITATSASVTWIGKSSLAPSSSKVQLQVYKVAAPAGWQDVSGAGASNNVAAADTDFTLSGTIATADYLDTGVTTFRIYQSATAGTPSDFAPHTMTGDSSPPYIADDSGHFGDQSGYVAFDGNLTYYVILNPAVGWITLDLGSGTSKQMYSYSIMAGPTAEAARAPNTWKMYGSNNGTEWTEIDSVAGQGSWGNFETRNFVCDTYTTAYRYFKLDITANNGDGSYTDVTELYFYELV